MREIIKVIEFPKTKNQEIPIIFHFESSKEEVQSVMLQHQANWIIKELQKYPMPERKILFDGLIKEIKERDKEN